MPRKTAICPRVSGLSGQKLPEPHPAVIPEAASASMNRKNVCVVGTSPNEAAGGAALTWSR